MNEYYKMVGEYYDTDALDFDKRYWQNPILQRIRQDIRENLKNIFRCISFLCIYTL